MIGVASLSLVACSGGGDSTVQTQQAAPVVPPTVPTAPVDPPAHPPVFGGFTNTVAGLAVNVVDQAAKEELPIFSTTDTRTDSGEWIGNRIYAVQHMNANWEPGNRNAGPFPKNYGQYNTYIKLVPSSSEDNINYSFEIWNLDNDTGYNIRRDGVSGGIASEPLGHPVTSRGKWDRKADSFDSDRYEVIPNKIDIETGFDYTILKTSAKIRSDGKDGGIFYGEEEDGTFYAEVWTNYSNDTTDWMAGGLWLIVPDDWTDTNAYRFSAFALGSRIFGSDFRSGANSAPWGVPSQLIGKATYEGPAVGLYFSKDDNMAKIGRLLGQVSISTDFTTPAPGNPPFDPRITDPNPGSLSGRISNLTLNGKDLPGDILLPEILIYDNTPGMALSFEKLPRIKQKLGNINGVNMTGEWGAMFIGETKTTAETYPTGVVGTVGGSGGGNSFVASFGAKKVETGE